MRLIAIFNFQKVKYLYKFQSSPFSAQNDRKGQKHIKCKQKLHKVKTTMSDIKNILKTFKT